MVLKTGEGNAENSKTAETEKKSVDKLFSSKVDTDGTEVQAAVASAFIGAVSGADVLQAISKSEEVKGEPTVEIAKNACRYCGC